jgi:hypothetical protein
MRPSLLLGLGFFSAILSPLACGSGETAGTSSSGTPDAGDGKFHPMGNGTHITEANACTTLANAQSAAVGQLGCAGTTRLCPDLLRAQFVTACLEYDEGSVQGCIKYYSEATTCDELNKNIGDCAITAFSNTMSAGCTM